MIDWNSKPVRVASSWQYCKLCGREIEWWRREPYRAGGFRYAAHLGCAEAAS